MRWTINGLDPILALRTLHQSDRLNLIWNNPPAQTTPQTTLAPQS